MIGRVAWSTLAWPCARGALVITNLHAGCLSLVRYGVDYDTSVMRMSIRCDAHLFGRNPAGVCLLAAGRLGCT